MTTKLLLIPLAFATMIVGSACSGADERTTKTNTDSTVGNTATRNSTATANTTASPNAGAPKPTSTADTGAASHGGAGGDIPTAVRTALPDATAITKQHKDIPASQVANIERETSTKIADADHHSYLGFTTNGGTRRQTGAATVVNVEGQEFVIVYDSKGGMPTIREVRGGDLAPDFRDQFKGRDHDDALILGKDIKAIGTPEATAKAITARIKSDVLTMQALYGGAHSH